MHSTADWGSYNDATCTQTNCAYPLHAVCYANHLHPISFAYHSAPTQLCQLSVPTHFQPSAFSHLCLPLASTHLYQQFVFILRSATPKPKALVLIISTDAKVALTYPWNSCKMSFKVWKELPFLRNRCTTHPLSLFMSLLMQFTDKHTFLRIWKKLLFLSKTLYSKLPLFLPLIFVHNLF